MENRMEIERSKSNIKSRNVVITLGGKGKAVAKTVRALSSFKLRPNDPIYALNNMYESLN